MPQIAFKSKSVDVWNLINKLSYREKLHEKSRISSKKFLTKYLTEIYCCNYNLKFIPFLFIYLFILDLQTMKNYISRLHKDPSEKQNILTIPKVIKEITKQTNYK